MLIVVHHAKAHDQHDTFGAWKMRCSRGSVGALPDGPRVFQNARIVRRWVLVSLVLPPPPTGRYGWLQALLGTTRHTLRRTPSGVGTATALTIAAAGPPSSAKQGACNKGCPLGHVGGHDPTEFGGREPLALFIVPPSRLARTADAICRLFSRNVRIKVGPYSSFGLGAMRSKSVRDSHDEIVFLCFSGLSAVVVVFDSLRNSRPHGCLEVYIVDSESITAPPMHG